MKLRRKLPSGLLPSLLAPWSDGPAVAAPRNEEEVVALVSWARKHAIPLAPFGARTSFWGNTPTSDRVAVDMRRMSRLRRLDPREMSLRVEAGVSVAALERALSRRGLSLPIVPDGFGTATIASLVANDVVAGHGSGFGPASSQVLGLTAVLGTGEVLRTGAASVLTHVPAFTSHGLPDLTGLFLASEGGLGIITEMVLRVCPAAAIRTLELHFNPTLENFRRLLDSARALTRERSVFSCVGHWPASGNSARAELKAASLASLEEASIRCRRIERALEQAGFSGFRWLNQNPPLWWEKPAKRKTVTGVALALPYVHAPKVLRLWQSKRETWLRSPALGDGGFLRFYFGAEGAAAVIGWNRADDPAATAQSRVWAEELARRLAPWGVPYRLGSLWLPYFRARIDPAYQVPMARLKRLFDPAGIMNPGVGWWSAVKRTRVP